MEIRHCLCFLIWELSASWGKIMWRSYCTDTNMINSQERCTTFPEVALPATTPLVPARSGCWGRLRPQSLMSAWVLTLGESSVLQRSFDQIVLRASPLQDLILGPPNRKSYRYDPEALSAAYNPVEGNDCRVDNSHKAGCGDKRHEDRAVGLFC